MARRSTFAVASAAFLLLAGVSIASALLAQSVAESNGQSQSQGDEKPADAASPSVAPDPPGLVRLSKQYDVWLDPKNKQVLVDGKVCLREGQLEMFACPQETKEHESIVAIKSKAMHVHAGLLAVGARPGKPVTFTPQYEPARGTVVDVTVQWKDKDGKQQEARAQDWILDTSTEKPMSHDWVFAGSQFWTDEQDGKRYYLADAGDFICVSNFPTAMLDLPVESSQDAGALLFEANTDRIPPLGTAVRLILKPRLNGAGKKQSSETSGEKPAGEPVIP